jgi:hypothetical protein
MNKGIRIITIKEYLSEDAFKKFNIFMRGRTIGIQNGEQICYHSDFQDFLRHLIILTEKESEMMIKKRLKFLKGVLKETESYSDLDKVPEGKRGTIRERMRDMDRVSKGLKIKRKF